MKDRRDEEVHVAEMNLSRDTALIPVTEARGRAHWPPATPQIAAVVAASEAGEWPKVGVLAPVFVNAGGTRTDVFAECRRYLALLRALLNECKQFTPVRWSSP